MQIKYNTEATAHWQNGIVPKCSKIYYPRMQYSRSFYSASISLLCQQQQIKSKQQKKKTTLLITSTLFLRQSARRSSRTEKPDLGDAVSTTSHIIPEEPVKKCTIRRHTQYEYMSSKQKRLDNIAPQLFVYQHSKEAAVIKKKKMNRLKMQYSIDSHKLEFIQRSNQRRNQRVQRSKSVPLPSIVKIRHKKAKTVTEQPYQGPIQKLDIELEKKIALLCYRQRNSRLVIRRKTCIQESKNSIYVSRDKLLKYHEAMVKKFDQFDTASYESSPVPARLQLKRTKFHKLNAVDNGMNQILTPRYLKDPNLHIQQRKASHSVIAQYVMDKTMVNNKNKRTFESKLPSIHQPSLNEFNNFFIAQKKSSCDVSGQQLLLQSKSQQTINKQISLSSKQTEFISGQIKLITGSKQLNCSIRMKTLPNDNVSNKSKSNLHQRLWPYFQ